MARETKVGLLAGLAFIVCFAVILANRGQLDSRIRNHTFLTKTDKPADSPVHFARKSGPQANSRTHSSQASRANPAVRHAQRPPSRVDMPVQNTRSQYSMTRPYATGPTGGQNQLPDRVRASGAHRGTSNTVTPPLISPVPPHNGALSEESSRQAPWHAVNQDHSRLVQHARANDELPRQIAAATTATPRSPVNRAKARVVTYRVKSGDTLYKIAASQMGKSSRRNVNAIFDANRAILSSPDQLKVNMNLVIPTGLTQETTLPSTMMSPTKHAATAKSQRSLSTKTTPSFRWYQIKTNDRYISIARKELGDAKRWHEIHQLNKKHFPDPDKIRVGVRIKLPLSNTVACSEPGC